MKKEVVNGPEIVPEDKMVSAGGQSHADLLAEIATLKEQNKNLREAMQKNSGTINTIQTLLQNTFFHLKEE